MKRYISYDIKIGNDYTKLYDYLEEISASKITESTYSANVSLNLNDFAEKLKSVTSAGDSMVIITYNNDGMFHRKVR